MARNRWRGEGDATHVDDDDEIISEVVTLGSALDEPEPAQAPRYRARGNIIVDTETAENVACAYLVDGPKAAALLAQKIAALLTAAGDAS